MSSVEPEDTDNSIDWIEKAIKENYLKYYEYEHFSNIKEIGSGGFAKVYRANRKNYHNNFALKSFFNLSNATTKEIVHELKLQREVDFHENIISFYGITTEIQSDGSKKYLLVMEYADGGTLQNYLKEHFNNLTWSDKFNMALQLSYAVSCLHDERIVHRDLHSNNILVHQNIIKLADFGLSKRIDAASNQLRLFGIIPYSDPKIFNRQRNNNNETKIYSLNEKSDVYSVGVLLWEISSGHPPFRNEPHDVSLATDISLGLRETPIPDTPKSYVNIYTDCWSGEPDKRPTINEVVTKLKEIITKENYDSNITINIQLSNEQQLINSNIPNDNSSHGNLSQLIQNFNEMNTKEMIELESLTSSNVNFIIIVNEIINILINDLFDDLSSKETCKKKIFNCLNNHNITLQETYNLLLNHQNNSDFIFVLGYFNQIGIGININEQEAFELYQKAANLGNEMGMICLGICYKDGIGTDVNNQKAFELAQKAANLGNEMGMIFLGDCYKVGIGTDINKQKAFELFQKAANLGNEMGMIFLGDCYKNGIGTGINKQKAFELVQKAAYLRNEMGMIALGSYYFDGIGTDVNKQKAFKLFQKAAKLGNEMGIFALGSCYFDGIGTDVNKQKAFILFQKAANLGNEMGTVCLGTCYYNGIGTDVNKQKAFELYQKAANLGNSMAQYSLGFLYEKGDGIEKNKDQAIYWYEKSAEQGHKDAHNKLLKLKMVIHNGQSSVYKIHKYH